MKRQIKWIIIGLGFALCLQVVISLAYTAVAFSAARSGVAVPQGTVSVIVLGATLGAFLIGGFVVGWMEERFRLGDAVAVALLTLGVNTLVYQALPANHKAQFVAGAWLADQAGHLAVTSSSLLFIGLAVIAAVAGAYWGWHTAVPSEGILTRVALLIGLIGAIVGPFVLLALWGRDPSNPDQLGLPVNFIVAVLVVLVAIVGIGFWLFTREARREAAYETEMSISPEAHRDEAHRKSA